MTRRSFSAPWCRGVVAGPHKAPSLWKRFRMAKLLPWRCERCRRLWWLAGSCRDCQDSALRRAFGD